ncbi:MAG: hypothetical protein JWN25_649 [Verrucomicrobiales bacterium]|nr:hypothetical protein [Verrucomicrobiales bacterium]MDB6131171.1 hypothetical protein [Verrucomicrobiales bacterium]
MASSFVPLIPPTGTALPTAAFKLKVVASNNPIAKTIEGEKQEMKANGAHEECKQSKPEITFHKEGETITKIRIICPCGQVIELGCQY